MYDLTIDSQEGEEELVATDNVSIDVYFLSFRPNVDVLINASHIVSIDNAIQNNTPIILDTTLYNSDDRRLAFAWYPNTRGVNRLYCVKLLDILYATLLRVDDHVYHARLVTALLDSTLEYCHTPDREVCNSARLTLVKCLGHCDFGRIRRVSYPGECKEYSSHIEGSIDVYLLPNPISCYRVKRLA